MINAGRPRGDQPSQEKAARWARIARRFDQARSREGSGAGGPLRLEITEALLIAQDLYMLGLIPDAPTLRWDGATTQAALHRWEVLVVPDGALTSNRPTAAR